MQSSLVLPFLGAIIFLHNPAGAMKYTGAAVLLAGLALLGLVRQGSPVAGSAKDGKFLLLTLGAFLLVGTSQFLRLIPGNVGFSEAALSWRLPVSAPCGMVIWTCLALMNRSFVPTQVWKVSLLYGLIIAVGQIFFFWAVDAADPLGMTSIVYPVAVGASILLFAVYCVFFRKERFTSAAWGGVSAIAAGIALLSIG